MTMYMTMLFRLLLLTLLILIAQPSWGAELLGRVVGIADGDTLTLLTADKRQVRVRLAGIDAPESRQPYGTRAQQELSVLAFGKDGRVEVQDTDRYGRTVGALFIGSLNVNQEMVRRGAAWVYTQYNRDPVLPRLEVQAREGRLGLWALPIQERQAPWDWRHSGGATGQSAAPRQSTPAPPSASGFTCGSKRYCGQMLNCAEARFYLRQCGVTRLDGNGDGVPCERLCR